MAPISWNKSSIQQQHWRCMWHQQHQWPPGPLRHAEWFVQPSYHHQLRKTSLDDRTARDRTVQGSILLPEPFPLNPSSTHFT